MLALAASVSGCVMEVGKEQGCAARDMRWRCVYHAVHIAPTGLLGFCDMPSVIQLETQTVDLCSAASLGYGHHHDSGMYFVANSNNSMLRNAVLRGHRSNDTEEMYIINCCGYSSASRTWQSEGEGTVQWKEDKEFQGWTTGLCHTTGTNNRQLTVQLNLCHFFKLTIHRPRLSGTTTHLSTCPQVLVRGSGLTLTRVVESRYCAGNRR